MLCRGSGRDTRGAMDGGLGLRSRSHGYRDEESNESNATVLQLERAGHGKLAIFISLRLYYTDIEIYICIDLYRERKSESMDKASFRAHRCFLSL
jgi:hypothetical protein